MANYNFDAALTVQGKRFFLSKEEMEEAGITETQWVNRSRPTLQVCTKLIATIKNKYDDQLIYHQTLMLAARIVNMIFPDFVNLLRIGGIDAEEGAYSFDALDKDHMESERQDALAISGQRISREEFEEYYIQKNLELKTKY